MKSTELTTSVTQILLFLTYREIYFLICIFSFPSYLWCRGNIFTFEKTHLISTYAWRPVSSLSVVLPAEMITQVPLPRRDHIRTWWFLSLQNIQSWIMFVLWWNNVFSSDCRPRIIFRISTLNRLYFF